VIKNIRDTIKKNLMQKQDVLIRRPNQIIVGWCNYHKHACSKKAYQTLDKEIFKSLWNWCKRRHSCVNKI
jgi:RNA-directed DNA polymerase